MLIGNGHRVLFQGDSITDCGRPRDGSDSHMGLGYPPIVAATMGYRHPTVGLTFLNRGVGGDCVPHLRQRWQADCIDLAPDWVSILIGINDSTCIARGDEGFTVAAYEAGYRDILTQVRDGSDAGVIIIEPFLLDTSHEYDFIPAAAEIRRHLDQVITVARQLGQESADVYVPLDGIFREASDNVDPAHWADDAIHPTPAGHALIADAWVNAVEAG